MWLQEHGRHEDTCTEAETKAERKTRACVACRLELEETMVDDGVEQHSLGVEGGTMLGSGTQRACSDG
jgi:hypothetical protein